MRNARMTSDTQNEITFQLISQQANDIGKVQTSLNRTETDIEYHIATSYEDTSYVGTQDVSNELDTIVKSRLKHMLRIHVEQDL